ncbi:P-loop containing nucleoside triphosphate hydrolase protein [Backusella circina FSU 941]|nr:P-loop containing nucleoside triphosphate hydrolase protein [Backusella circina FSU 941]
MKRLYSTVLRPYQSECIETCLNELEQGCKRQAVSLPVAHRKELLTQAHAQIQKANPSLSVQIEQGRNKFDIDKTDVIVASVPALGRNVSARLDRYDPSQFKAILIDEAHHAAASSYTNILKHFDLVDPKSPNKIFLWGCSATLRRHDGLALRNIFEKITFHVDFLQMIENKWLSNMKVTVVNTKIDLGNVKIAKDDFNQAQLARAVNTDTRNDTIVSTWKKLASDDRKATLVFGVDVAHTVDLCNKFREANIDAEFITAKTPAATRRDILDRFNSGTFPVLVNCAILTEGVDIPRVDCILMAKPTRSSVLFQQMFGRGLRLFNGKKNCLIIDFVDTFESQGSEGLVTIPTLLGLDPSQLVTGENILALESRAGDTMAGIEDDINDISADIVKLKITEYESLEEFLNDNGDTMTLRNVTSNYWLKMSDKKYLLYVFDKGYLTVEKSTDGLWKGFFRHASTRFYSKTRPLPLESDALNSAIRAADTWVTDSLTKENKAHILPLLRRNAAFRSRPASTSQIKALEKYKVDIPFTPTKGQAMDILTRIKFGQRREIKEIQLQIKRLKAKAEKMSRKQSMATLQRTNNDISL